MLDSNQLDKKVVVSSFLNALFQQWRDANVLYLVLRNYAELPEYTDNDIDILIAPEQIKGTIDIIQKTALETGWKLHNVAEFACYTFYLFHEDTLEQIHIDLMPGLKWHSLIYGNHEIMLEKRGNFRSFFIPHAAHEASINLLTRLLYGGYVREKYRYGICQVAKSEPDEMRDFMKPWIGGRLADEFVVLSREGRWAEIEKKANNARVKVLWANLRHPIQLLQRICHDIARLLRRWVRPPGLCVAFIGPDGCGKSTVGKAVAESLSGSFSPLRTRHYHWKPIPQKGNTAPTTDPHAKPPRGRFLSLIYFSYHWLCFIWGWWFYVQPVLFKNGLVLIDRYYYDFFVDLRRYRLTLPPWVVKLGFRYIKKPDLVFYLDAPAEILQNRKSEVPIAESSRQVTAYKLLMESLNNSVSCNSSVSLEDVCQNVCRRILGYMASRARVTSSYKLLKNAALPL